MADTIDPNPRARERLVEILRNDPQGMITGDPARLQSMLAGWGGYEAENALLMHAYEQRVPQDLMGAPPGSVNRLVDFLSSRLSTVAAIPYVNAKWAVESWAIALGKEFDPPLEAPQAPAIIDMPVTPNAKLAPEPPSVAAAAIPLPAPPAPPSAPPTLAGPRTAGSPGDIAPAPAWQATTAWQAAGPQVYTGDPNTSGTLGPLPPEVERLKWSWGAFQLSWIWYFCHNLVGLGVVAMVFACLCPLGSLGLAIYGGVAGTKLAWQNRRYESVEQFLAIERIWGNWGIAFFVLELVFAALYLWAKIAHPGWGT